MSVKLELVQNGRVLPSYQHEGKHFVEAPPEGEYTIRLTNTTFGQKLCVLTVDGINVCDGEKGSFSGPGYVIRGLQTINIPGWRRTSSEVAAFQFKPQEKSYTAQMGNGTSNTGVVGLAVFDEKEKPQPVHIHHHHWPKIQQDIYRGPYPVPTYTYPSNGLDPVLRGAPLYCSTAQSMDLEREGGYNEIHEAVSAVGAAPCAAAACSSDDTGYEDPVQRSTGPTLKERLRAHVKAKSGGGDEVSMDLPLLEDMWPSKSVKVRGTLSTKGVTRSVEDLGTGYGQKQTLHTTEITFERASKEPSFLITVQYAMRERLIEWGVPVSKPSPSPSAFPASIPMGVPAPAGWRG